MKPPRSPGLVCLLLALSGLASAARAPTEYQVKAVFLFNFAKFVDWPALTYVSASAPFALCVYGDDPFGTDLDELVRGEAIGGRPMVVRRIHDLGELSRCQIVFVSGSADRELESVLVMLDRRPTLTVSDSTGAARRGAMIRMMNVNGRIRLRVNIDAVHSAHLSVSSSLLRAADVVGSATPGDDT